MIDSIFIGMSGLQTFSSGLKVISNNVSNLNTPGFKASSATFGDLYYQDVPSGQQGEGGPLQYGTGVTTAGTFVNFKAGDTQQTGNPLDLSINGDGFFVTQDAKDGSLTYSRAGQFELDKDGNVVVRGSEQKLMGYSAGNSLEPIALGELKVSKPKATTKVSFVGNLSSTATDFSVDSVKLIDSLGGEHDVKLTFKAKDGAAGTWTVTMTDAGVDTEIGDIKFIAGSPDPSAESLTLHYSPTGGGPAFDVNLDFSTGVTSFSTGATSTLAVSTSDGQAMGQVSSVTFNESGVMTINYSNGQTASGPQIALARVDYDAALEQSAGGQFTSKDPQAVHVGRAASDGYGKIASSQVEGSNVDLSTEFSNLIIMQRGYQAASEIVNTANSMLQNLFDMKTQR
jgi:flagellar hook protein FlgE